MKTNNILKFLLIFCLSLNSYSQNTITIDTTINTDCEIFPFQTGDTIYSLRLNGQAILNSDTSLVRVILSDEGFDDYMIFETYPLISDNDTVVIENKCDETCYFDEFLPYSIKFEISDGSIYIDDILCDNEYTDNALMLQVQAKYEMDTVKADQMKITVKEYKMNWKPGTNSISRLYYSDKKRLFGDKYNLLGFDYYKGGIYESIGSLKSLDTSNLVKTFDWRNRHGANNPDSPYYDYDDSTKTGWLTSIKNQAEPLPNCGSCYAHSAIGATEAVINLYYNSHLDFNLSEQELVCDPDNNGCISGSPLVSLGYIRTDGVVSEDCFKY